MKTFSVTMVSVMAIAAYAFAQSGSGSAGKGSAAPSGKGSAAPAAKGSAAPAGKGSAAPAGPPAESMGPPKPPAEIAALVKDLGARRRCTGVAYGPDFKTEIKLVATLKTKSDLDGWFIRQNLDGTVGQGRDSMKIKSESLYTFDTNAKKWRSVSALNDGGLTIATGDAMTAGKLVMQADSFGPGGQGLNRDYVEVSDPKAGVRLWGEMSQDKGKTWGKVYDLTCKK